MKVKLLKDCTLHKGGLKKKKGTEFIVHKDFGIKLIKDGKADVVKEKGKESFFKFKKK